MSNTGTLATQICESLRRSTQALYGVNLDGLTKDEREAITVKAYANCREQGFTVKIHAVTDPDSFQCSFAEEKGTDRMVLYWGHVSNFDIQCGIPDRETYERAEYFKTEKQLATRLQKLVRPAAKFAQGTFRK